MILQWPKYQSKSKTKIGLLYGPLPDINIIVNVDKTTSPPTGELRQDQTTTSWRHRMVQMDSWDTMELTPI